jgi:hypothetical protein
MLGLCFSPVLMTWQERRLSCFLRLTFSLSLSLPAPSHTVWPDIRNFPIRETHTKTTTATQWYLIPDFMRACISRKQRFAMHLVNVPKRLRPSTIPPRFPAIFISNPLLRQPPTFLGLSLTTPSGTSLPVMTAWLTGVDLLLPAQKLNMTTAGFLRECWRLPWTFLLWNTRRDHCSSMHGGPFCETGGPNCIGVLLDSLSASFSPHLASTHKSSSPSVYYSCISAVLISSIDVAISTSLGPLTSLRELGLAKRGDQLPAFHFERYNTLFVCVSRVSCGSSLVRSKSITF